ncbi:F-box family protein [Corchorus olitorius]|uniref:F-box family protein n=1 Tax=Corchorus olitorius TaxID=93759 RepID=A0A1R3JR96_9ROSI|nr:F-box family protein [Corchorus olitorius]
MSKINQDSAKHQEEKEEVIIKEDLRDRGLPTELLELILSKLIFVVDIINFHAVCKTWRSITVSVPPPCQLPPPLPYADSSYPLLFQLDGDHNKYRVLHTLYNYTWIMDFPPQVRDGRKEICFSKYGWSLLKACIINTEFCIPYAFLFNPLTQEIIKLPAIPDYHGYPQCMFFTCPPSHWNCLVVAISLSYSIYVHKLGKADWKQHPYFHNFEPISHPILCQGLWYCLGHRRKLIVFDIRNNKPSWIVHKDVIPSRRKVSAHLTALVEHNGQLLVVFIRGRRRRPYILKFDLETKSCVPIRSLGKDALFISKGASFSQRAIVSGTQNKIFLPILRTKTDLFQFYSLATWKYCRS